MLSQLQLFSISGVKATYLQCSYWKQPSSTLYYLYKSGLLWWCSANDLWLYLFILLFFQLNVCYVMFTFMFMFTSVHCERKKIPCMFSHMPIKNKFWFWFLDKTLNRKKHYAVSYYIDWSPNNTLKNKLTSATSLQIHIQGKITQTSDDAWCPLTVLQG